MSATKRQRRTKAEMETIRETILAVLAADHPQTVRQVYYRLTSANVIGKTEAEYKGTVCRLLAEMRRAGEIPYTWLADSTRWMRRPDTFTSVEQALQITAEAYRRSLWADSPDQVEIWLEKEALAGVLVEVTDPWDVPLMVTRGYASMSYLYSAATSIAAAAERGQHTYIYYFGDNDPSGRDIDRAIVEGIGESLGSLIGLAPQSTPRDTFDALATFERIAVTEDQIVDLALPTRPTKKSDTRAKSFTGESVEVDAIPAQRLKDIAEEAIVRHVDHHRLDVLRKVEAEERKGLIQLAGVGSRCRPPTYPRRTSRQRNLSSARCWSPIRR